jgi:hypothetical protein
MTTGAIIDAVKCQEGHPARIEECGCGFWVECEIVSRWEDQANKKDLYHWIGPTMDTKEQAIAEWNKVMQKA